MFSKAAVRRLSFPDSLYLGLILDNLHATLPQVKLVLQIALGVFIGMSASQLLVDAWRTHRQEQITQAEDVKRDQLARERQQQAETIRKLVSEKLQQQAVEAPAEAALDVMPQEPEIGETESSDGSVAQP